MRERSGSGERDRAGGMGGGKRTVVNVGQFVESM